MGNLFNKGLIPKLKNTLDKIDIPRPKEFINISTTVLDEKDKCLHDNCPICNGTGISKITGTPCIHNLSCNCPKCSIR